MRWTGLSYEDVNAAWGVFSCGFSSLVKVVCWVTLCFSGMVDGSSYSTILEASSDISSFTRWKLSSDDTAYATEGASFFTLSYLVKILTPTYPAYLESSGYTSLLP